jgi:hypothetical protein
MIERMLIRPPLDGRAVRIGELGAHLRSHALPAFRQPRHGILAHCGIRPEARVATRRGEESLHLQRERVQVDHGVHRVLAQHRFLGLRHRGHPPQQRVPPESLLYQIV